MLAGSAIGGIRETQEMLDFCAAHGVAAEIERISGEQINEAWDRVVNSDVASETPVLSAILRSESPRVAGVGFAVQPPAGASAAFRA